MELSEFEYIKHFTPSELRRACTDIKNVDFYLIQKLDKLRRIIKVPIVITCLDKGIHKPRSQHYPRNTQSKLCEAVDFKLLAPKAKNEILQRMLDVGFTGIGINETFYHGDTRLGHKLWKRVQGIYLPLV